MSDATLQSWLQARDVQVGSRFVSPNRPGLASLLTFGLVLGVSAAFAMALLMLVTMRPPSPAPAPVVPAPVTPVWLDIVKPVQIYSLEAHDLAKSPLIYTARRRSEGDTREDVLTFGTWHGDQPSLRLRILRNGTDHMVALDTTIVRLAADVGLGLGRSRLPETLKTRFGAFEIADVEVPKSVDTKAPMQCSGFRLHLAKPILAVDGLACGVGGHPIARRTLGCLIDRLDLASAGEDRVLGDFFASTELRRNAACDGMRLGPDGLHAPWLDEKPSPDKTGAASTEERPHHHAHRRH